VPGKKPNKKELARMRVMYDLGNSPTTIAGKLGKSHHTVIKYLQSEVYNDPSIKEIVEKIRDKELDDLTLLGAKARQRLHDLLDEGKAQLIPALAVVDRSFGMRRLLEGRSTVNVGLKTQLIEAAHRQDNTKNNAKINKQEDKDGS